MDFLRLRWQQLGIAIAFIFGGALVTLYDHFTSFLLLLSISFITLLLHQFEEYQLPGGFPQMVNTVMFKSKSPNRFPLNPNTALIINVVLGWVLYVLAIVFAEQAVWLAIASIMVSIGNVVAHGILFNIKGKSLYNPGMATALLLFLPLSIYFFVYLANNNLYTATTLIGGIILGIFINYLGVIKMITLLANKKTPYSFKPKR